MMHTPRFTLMPTAYDRVSQILKEVAQAHGVTVNDLRSDRRFRHIAHARQEAYTRLRDETAMSYPAIARVMAKKDHTTIIHGERVCRQRIKEGSDE